jgi:hypothetical protein
MVADQNDGYDFEAAGAALQAAIPPDIAVTGINRAEGPFEQVRARILGAIYAGPLVVNYLGHGNVDTWTVGLLTAADAPALTNGGRLPLFVLMTCLNGYYPDPGLDSLGGALLQAEAGGAVAVWASSGMNAPGAQATVDQALISALFDGSSHPLGDLVRLAKQATPDLNVRRTGILLGDPTLRLRKRLSG